MRLKKRLGSIKRWFARKIANEKVKRLLLGFYIRLHNLSYRKISALAKSINGNVHPKHEILGYPRFFIDNIYSEDTVLDVGHGTGHLARRAAEKARFVTGIDITNKIGPGESGRRNLKFITGDATVYPFEKKFDKIILSNVLEHIEDRVGLLRKLGAISDTILLRVPMISRDWITVYKKQSGFEYRLDDTHFIEYTLTELEDELARSGWHLASYQINWGEIWGILKRT